MTPSKSSNEYCAHLPRKQTNAVTVSSPHCDRNLGSDWQCHPAWLIIGPAAKAPSAKGFSAGGADDTGAVIPQGPVWIGKDFRFDRTPWAPSKRVASGISSSAARRPHWRRGHWHTVLHGEKRHSRRMQWFQPVYVGLG